MFKFHRLAPLVTASVLLLLTTLSVAQASDYSAEPWTLPTEPGHLSGTVLLPEGDGPWPAVLILAGSGATDRNGNPTQFPGGNNSLKQLAEHLAGDGVASLRVDKRGVAGSVSAVISEYDLRFEHFINDAVAWCEKLQDDPRFSSVTVVGHSQGAQVGMNAAWLSAADGFVSISGPGRDFFTVLREQLRTSLPVRTRVKAESVLLELEQGRIVEEPPIELTILFRSSVQPFMISWYRHDPVVELARLAVPVLVVQGLTDQQVSLTDAEALMGAQPDAHLVMVEGMNHVLKMVAADNAYAQQSSLVDSTLIIAPEVPAAVADLAREADRAAASRRQAEAAVLKRAQSGQRLMAPAREDSILAAEYGLNTPEKMGRWARRFADAQDVVYLFGPKDGGYVAEGAIISDHRQDCVSLLYRVGELARARDAQDAVAWALRTRFSGAGAEVVADKQGRLDYENPAHLDYSLDMIRTGLWGRDVTSTLTGAAADTTGSSRYAAGSFEYVPTGDLLASELSEGDVLWFVLDAAHKSGAKLRQEYGLVVGHIGIVVVDDGEVGLIHAASSDLKGAYKGGTVVRVPLFEYLTRVDKFAGVMVTRF